MTQDTTPVIKKTLDYNKFKILNFNRKKSNYHIQNLKKRILEENLLHLHPILINEKMEVVDGQHRLEAARQLGIEIYFIQANISYEHILHSNLFHKKLPLKEVIKFYAYKDGIEDYLYLFQNSEMLDLSIKSLLGLYFGVVSTNMVELIKSGKFSLPSIKDKLDHITLFYEKFLLFCKNKRITPLNMIRSHNFTIAFRNLCEIDSFSLDVFIKKLDFKWFELKPQINSKEWTKTLIDIYNWKNQNPISYGIS